MARRITETSAGPSGSVPAQSSPLVTAPVLAASSTQDNASDDNNDLAGQTDSLATLTNERVSADACSGTSDTLTDSTTSGSHNGNNNGNDDDDHNDNSVSNQATSTNDSLTTGPSNVSSSSKKTRAKKPKKVTGKYVVRVRRIQSALITTYSRDLGWADWKAGKKGTKKTFEAHWGTLSDDEKKVCRPLLFSSNLTLTSLSQ